ncbi:MAG: membrane protein insertase YidC [Candidatus Marinimicrobia bacterium]|nr:membrane protein insertase YidC [Candidatus Neomarinimicrobiota bacterium]MDD5582768.1 membrane protein insertase YidC [Candidatus Neomarinimicrobiota bacterium]
MFDKNTLIAFILIALVIIFMPLFQRQTLEEPSSVADKVETETAPTRQDSLVPVTIPAESRTLESNVWARHVSPTEMPVEKKELVFSTENFFLTLSNLGGGTITQFRFKKYTTHKGDLVHLLKPEAMGNLGLEFPLSETENLNFNTIPFHSSLYEKYGHLDTVIVQEPLQLTFSLNTGENLKITRTFTFDPEDYTFDLVVSLENYISQSPNMMYTINWYDGFAITERNPDDDLMYSYVYSKVGDELTKLQLKEKEQRLSTDGDAQWVALRSKYFLASIIAESNSGIRADLYGIRTKKERFFTASLFMRLPLKDHHEDHFKIVIAPLDESYLTSLGYGHEHVMNWGWKIIKPLSVGILKLLKFMNSFIPNYGVILLIFSLLIKIILYPLTHKSYESMKRMQELQPLLMELREKHANNPQALNQATMKLYKDYGVNPLGGCLPMLIQLPLLYALFIIFRTTIELRGASFIWWIQDLSSPDVVFTLPFSIPLYGKNVAILPIIMAITMIVQQKISGGSQVNQQQKIMMWIMPIFFLLIFNNFPSGLNLYYTSFNILTILQQKFFINPSVHAKLKEQQEKIRQDQKKIKKK